MSERRAMIFGHKGQDGRLLTEVLLGRGYAVLGVGRNEVHSWGTLPSVDACCIATESSVSESIRRVQPHEVYYLAAHHVSSQDPLARDTCADLLAHFAVNTRGALFCLEAIRNHSPSTRFFYASSSLIFGQHPPISPLDEESPACPAEPYATTKLLSGQACRTYREQHGVFASVGILFNHESALRPRQFLSMRIAEGVCSADRGGREKLTIGNLDALVDWGYAPDFVDAFTRILAWDTPDDFVVATGVPRTVREFLATAYGHVGLNWEDFVTEDSALLTAPQRSGRIGSPAKLKQITGWHPTVSFEEMAAKLVDEVAARG